MAVTPQHATLVANTVKTMTLDRDYAMIDVCNVDGVAAIFFTVDGSTPTVGGDGAFQIPAAIGNLQIAPRNAGAAHTGVTVVKLISAGAPAVTVSGL